ncbi:hypothetical protein LPJ81_005640 [Coemansia sp. IMI 209127]|nr:hypothetical protein LPJ81_005640 [Coemansia sp. IMI 209127]
MDYNDELLNSIRNVVKPDSGNPVPVVTSAWPSSSAQASPTLSNTASSQLQTSTTVSSSERRPPSPSSTNESIPRVGDSCGLQPSYKCLAGDGKGSSFILCASGTWIQQQCGAGTACVQNGDYIYCDWPR